MYNTYNSTSNAHALTRRDFRAEPKPVRRSNLATDTEQLNEYMGFFEKHPNPQKWQLKMHLKENDEWMRMLDGRINDCEHIIALANIAEVDEETVQKAHKLLAEALGLRIRMKGHRQEVLYRLNETEQPFSGKREYRMRTLQSTFGNTITIEDGAMVFH